MAETEEQNESIALYRFMCENIVGSEEHVKTIRMMNTVRDNLQSNNQNTHITSGSFGEGLEIKGSDLDIMEVIKRVEICEDKNTYCKQGTVYFIMQIEDSQPGFTQLRLLYTNDQSVLKECEKIGSDYYFSNLSLKQKFPRHGLTSIHGPCIADELGLLDIAYCLHSKSWITPAKQWITRSNNSWPVCEVKQSIVKHGVLFVPIGVKGSIKEDLEWRISFSVGEKLLIYTFTHTQLLCYALMKILLKDVIASDPNVAPDLLCSYFMKTVIFWISEELSTSIWKPENLTSCFMRCFRRLIYYVKFCVCPHYFIPSNNLFENKIKGQVREILLNKLIFLNNFGWRCILLSEQIMKFDMLPYGIKKNPLSLHVRNIETFSCSRIYAADNVMWARSLILKKGIHSVLFAKSSKIKSLYTYYISKLNNRLLPYCDIFNNKFTYSQYNTVIRTLLMSTHHNAVSGWLLLASLFYRTKEYNIALDILQYCHLKCTPDKLLIDYKLTYIHKELFNLPVFRKLTIAQLSKFLLIDTVLLPPISELVPNELRIADEDIARRIHPAVYIHILRILCHYHLGSIRQCWDFLHALQLFITDNKCYANSHIEAISYNILGIMFQLLGDTHSARQAFIQSLEIEPDPNLNDASRRLNLIG